MYPNFIQHLKRYIKLSAAEEQLLISFVKPITLKKKDYLLREGETCKANYFVESGCLRMFFINEKGTAQIVQFALENWWMADNMSLIMQKPSPFYIQAIENAAVIAIDWQKQDELFSQIPQLERYFRIIMQRVYAASQMRLKFFYDYSKEENYRAFVSLFPEFVQRIPQYMLASYLGLTPEYLSELRKR